MKSGRGIRRGWIVALGFAAASILPAGAIDRAANVILFIGDGMGTEHVKAARYFKGAPLCFETFPYFASVDTESPSGVPDSAAAATAIATGMPVANGVVSLAIPGDAGERQTVLEYFQGKGKRSGLVTTDVMTGATPACFGAHAESRADTGNIAGDYLAQTHPEVLYGGGGVDPEAAQAAGYQVVRNSGELAAIDPATATNVAGFFGDDVLPYEYDGLGDCPHLWEMTSNAVAILEHGARGFFLMVEEAGIDHAAHAYDAPRMIRAALALDAAVQAALDWASNRTDTLILVMGDHETCGLVVTNDNGGGNDPGVEWTADWHTAAPVGCWARGAGGERAAETMALANIHDVVVAAALFQSWCEASVDTPTNVAMTWQSTSGETFRVEYSDGLESPVWHPLGVVTADSDSFAIVDSDVGLASNRFYRAISVP